jgi:hypothetical protein
LIKTNINKETHTSPAIRTKKRFSHGIKLLELMLGGGIIGGGCSCSTNSTWTRICKLLIVTVIASGDYRLLLDLDLLLGLLLGLWRLLLLWRHIAIIALDLGIVGSTDDRIGSFTTVL